MAGNRNYNSRYIYETSPRKLKPDYIPNQKKKPIQKKKSTTLKGTNKKQNEKTEQKVKAKSKGKKIKCVLYLLIGFAVLFAMSYRNSQIDESFSKLKASEAELSLIQKENEQLEVSIENSLNLSEVERIAREQLGMQKASSSQTRYISLPKQDHVEGAAEEIQLDKSKNIFEIIIDYIKNIF
ncbi:MAG: cell division protein FtsL [Clostridia bacterium]|nr:cell division protein FtsL [Clostridia bacterium]